jgi:quercetin dioxygenase-like cupin family protein
MRGVLLGLMGMLVAEACLTPAFGEPQPQDSSPASASREPGASSAADRPKAFYRAADTGPAVWGPGDFYTFLASGEETSGAFSQIHAVIPKGGGPPLHIHHREEESFYVLRGSLEIYLDGRVISAKAGDYVFIPRGTPHRFTNVGEETAVQLVTFAPAGMDSFLKEVYPVATDRNAPIPPVTEELIQQMNAAAPKYHLEVLPAPGAAAESGDGIR